MTLLPANYDEASIAVVSLADQQTKVVLERAGLYLRSMYRPATSRKSQGDVVCGAFDLSTMEVRGAPKRVLEDVSNEQSIGFAQLALSENGTLIYHRGRTDALRTLHWLRADDTTESLKLTPASTTCCAYLRMATGWQ